MRFRPKLPLGLLLVLALALPASANATTYEVSTNGDSNAGTCMPGACTLRQAVNAANAGSGGDTIKVPPGDYPLVFGELQLSKSMTIVGAGRDATRIDGLATSRIFGIPGTTVTVQISGLTVENGQVLSVGPTNAQGGGISNSGTLMLEDVAVRGNRAVPGPVTPQLIPSGGGIFNTGTLRVSDSVIDHNEASTLSNSGIPLGGGIANEDGEVVVADSIVSNNRVSSESGGISNGGGLYSAAAAAHGASVLLTGTIVEGNEAHIVGAAGIAEGGGIFSRVGDMTIVESSLLRNEATGGAIAIGGGLMVRFGGDFLLDRSLVAGNVAEAPSFGDGGGLTLEAEGNERQRVVNSTIASNRATGSTGSSGGGIQHRGTTILELQSVTLSDNTVSGGGDSQGGNLQDAGFMGGATRLRDAIVSGGAGASGFENCEGPGIQSDGHNIDSLDQCNFHSPGDKVNTNPRLDPLADNGGRTRTMALRSDSPAIDAGDACPPTDQRGIARPQGPACDIGAFEYVPPIVLTPSSPPSGAALLGLPKRVKINLRTGKGTARTRCLNVAGDSCTAALGLLVHVRVPRAKSSKKKTKTVLIGTAKGTIAGGTVGRLKIELRRKGLKRLRTKRNHALKVKALGQSTNSAGQATSVTAKLTLQGKRAKKKKKR